MVGCDGDDLDVNVLDILMVTVPNTICIHQKTRVVCKNTSRVYYRRIHLHSYSSTTSTKSHKSAQVSGWLPNELELYRETYALFPPSAVLGVEVLLGPRQT